VPSSRAVRFRWMIASCNERQCRVKPYTARILCGGTCPARALVHRQDACCAAINAA
jgi:hypothetical protein